MTIWVFQGEQNPTKVVIARSTLKQTVARFFRFTGYVALEQLKTVNSEWYTTIYLPEVVGEIRKKQKKSRIILHHDGMSSRTLVRTNNFLKYQSIELKVHKLYSPKLAPNDFVIADHVAILALEQRRTINSE